MAAASICGWKDSTRQSARHARRLIAVAQHDLQYELVAIAELAALAEPLALERWRRLCAIVRTPPQTTGDASVAA